MPTTIRHAFAAACFAISLSACFLQPDNNEQACQGESSGVTVRNVASGLVLPHDCTGFGAIGHPQLNPDYLHTIEIRLKSGVFITLAFPHVTMEGTTLTIAANSQSVDVNATASLTDESGFEGSIHNLCNGDSTGMLHLDRLVVDTATGLLTSVDGSATVSFTQCTSQALGVNNGTVTLDVQF